MNYRQELKRFLCDPNRLTGKLVNTVSTAFSSTLIKIDVRDRDELEIACPCCMFWRGVLLGSMGTLLIALLIL